MTKLSILEFLENIKKGKVDFSVWLSGDCIVLCLLNFYYFQQKSDFPSIRIYLKFNKSKANTLKWVYHNLKVLNCYTVFFELDAYSLYPYLNEQCCHPLFKK